MRFQVIFASCFVAVALAAPATFDHKYNALNERVCWYVLLWESGSLANILDFQGRSHVSITIFHFVSSVMLRVTNLTMVFLGEMRGRGRHGFGSGDSSGSKTWQNLYTGWDWCNESELVPQLHWAGRGRRSCYRRRHHPWIDAAVGAEPNDIRSRSQMCFWIH